MFQKGDYIMYGNVGVCQVEDVGVPSHISTADPDRTYYTLRPVYQTGTIYIPVDTKIFMRPLLTEKEVLNLIDRIPEIKEEQVEGRNLRVLSDRYEASLRTHACEDLIQLIKTIYVKGQTVRQNGRQLGQTDQRYFKRAEELLYGEFAIALHMPIDEVKPYLEKILDQEEQKNE